MALASVMSSPSPWPPETTASASGFAPRYASAASSRLHIDSDGVLPVTPAPSTMIASGCASVSVRASRTTGSSKTANTITPAHTSTPSTMRPTRCSRGNRNTSTAMPQSA